MLSTIRTATAAGLVLAGSTAAHAAFVDFTDPTSFSTATAASATGTAAGAGFTVTGSAPALTYNFSTGPGAVGMLAGTGDGIGIGDDEIGGTEWISVTFDRKVRLTGAAFLDLFRNPSAEAERVSVYEGEPPSGAGFLASLDAIEPYSKKGAGYGFLALSAVGTTFAFDPGLANDGFGIGDFALAGLSFEELAPIPLPASGAVLAGSLAGLWLLRRRQRR